MNERFRSVVRKVVPPPVRRFLRRQRLPAFLRPPKPDFVERNQSRVLWLDLGDLGDLVRPMGAHEQWQDHGLGLLRTVLHGSGIKTDMFSTRQCDDWDEVARHLVGYDTLAMNVRSYTYPGALRAARLFKQANPRGTVLVGGMHATVAPDEMEAVAEFDHIVKGAGETIIVNLVRDPSAFPRTVVARARRRWRTGRRSIARCGHVLPAAGWPGVSTGHWSPNAGGVPAPWPPCSPAASVPGNAFSAMRPRTSRTWGGGRWTC